MLRGFLRFFAQMPHFETHMVEMVAETSAPGTIEDKNQSSDEEMAGDGRRRNITRIPTNIRGENACTCDGLGQTSPGASRCMICAGFQMAQL